MWSMHNWKSNRYYVCAKTSGSHFGYLFTFPPPLLFNIPLRNFSPTTATACSSYSCKMNFSVKHVTDLIAQGIGARGSTHLQVNHMHNVVDPATGAHTQNFENNRTNAKMLAHRQMVDSYLSCFLSYRSILQICFFFSKLLIVSDNSER